MMMVKMIIIMMKIINVIMMVKNEMNADKKNEKNIHLTKSYEQQQQQQQEPPK